MFQGISIILATIILSLVEAERTTVPSEAVCDTYPNEEFAIDLTRCQNTCAFYGRTWDCPNNYYKPNGDCYCKAGFARLTEDYGKCVSVKNNAACVAKLPIKPESCNGPNEIYTEKVRMGACDNNCLTYGCRLENPGPENTFKWSPQCICGENDDHYTGKQEIYRRLSNGICVAVSNEQCVAKFQPSAERCAALGQIYQVNAPCQASCYGEQYCPPPGGACICPPNKLAVPYDSTYFTWVKHVSDFNGAEYYSSISHPTTVIACYSEATCPTTKFVQPQM